MGSPSSFIPKGEGGGQTTRIPKPEDKKIGTSYAVGRVGVILSSGRGSNEGRKKRRRAKSEDNRKREKHTLRPNYWKGRALGFHWGRELGAHHSKKREGSRRLSSGRKRGEFFDKGSAY